VKEDLCIECASDKWDFNDSSFRNSIVI